WKTASSVGKGAGPQQPQRPPLSRGRTDLARWLRPAVRAGLTVLLCPSSQLPGPAAARPGSSWSARSRAAARTNELDAGERRKIIEGEEGVWLRLACQGSRAGSRRVAGGVVSQAPIRRRASARLP